MRSGPGPGGALWPGKSREAAPGRRDLGSGSLAGGKRAWEGRVRRGLRPFAAPGSGAVGRGRSRWGGKERVLFSRP